MQRNAFHCGLDFGTSNSTLATAPRGAPAELLPLENGRTTIPSAIFFDFAADRTLFGREGIAAYVGHRDGRMMRALKSILGSQLAEESVRIKRRIIPFLDIVGGFVGELKRRAEAAAGHAFEQVVCGRPVHFVDDDPERDRAAESQLRAAVEAQGFRHVAFQFEPIAAALDYEQRVTREELGLVVDLGGGTSDFSVVRVSPERARAQDREGDILATAGIHLGGTDFDRLLSLATAMRALGYQTQTLDAKRVLPSHPYVDLATWHRINRLYAPEAMRELEATRREAAEPHRVADLISVVAHREGHRLAGAVEDAKIALTDAHAASIDFAGEEVRLALPITRARLSDVLAGPVARIAGTVSETLRLAGIVPDRIDTLILTGGSTRIPAIVDELRRLFPTSRFVESDAFGSVGLGLALDARRRFG